MRILSYNVWGLPFCASKRRCNAIAEYIRSILPTCDVVVLQEVWATQMKECIRRVLGDAGWTLVESPPTGMFRINGGVWMATPHPIRGSASYLPFEHSSGTDTFAEKGALSFCIRETTTGFVHRIVGFHMQNGEHKTGIRKSQARQMLSEYGLDATYVGDTNEPSRALDSIMAIPGIRPLCATHANDGCIDYAFSSIDELSAEILCAPAGLSDHFPVMFSS